MGEANLASVNADPQFDLTPAVKPFTIAEIRDATNTINNLMDDTTAAGVQRLQRLMIFNMYTFEDDAPFPVSRKGVVQKRGEKRLQRVKQALKDYITNSKELLA